MEQASCQITGVSFRLFAESEAKRLSVLSIANPFSLDPLGHPIDNGLSDTALGPLKRNDLCKTCGLTDSHCLGHFGHISLPLPVFNPFLMKQLFQVLRMFCFNCHHLLFSRQLLEVYIAQLRALNLGLDYIVDDILEYANEITNNMKGFDWSTAEGQTFLRSRLNEKINWEFTQMTSTQTASSKSANISIKQESQPSTSSFTANENISLIESVEFVNSKNVIEKKQQIFKDFFGGKLIKPSKVCHQCQRRKAYMNVVNRSTIVLSAARAAKSMARLSTGSNINGGGGEDNTEDILVEMNGKSYLMPSQARAHLRELWKNERETLLRIFPFINFDIEIENQKSIFNTSITEGGDDNAAGDSSSSSPFTPVCPLDVFFWETIIVPPNRFRPLRYLNGRSFEHYRTTALAELMVIAKAVEATHESVRKTKSKDDLVSFQRACTRLQIACNRLYDARMDNLPDNKAIGVKQILEKKEGLLRKNMMGKRVNFAARSVISPDPYINVDEIGVPVIFATRLSYPQPVTTWNVKQLQEMILNGPTVWPGALSITYEDGYTVRLKPNDIGQRRKLAATIQPPTMRDGMAGVIVVNRHLISGDVLLLNRQPTLHKPSIMAHKARVLPREKTLRLHYANCKCYNADFDGDEMNAHFPQSELARAEAYGVASVNYQFLVPKDGSPLSGLIQDHIIAGFLLTIRGRFFTKADYQQLCFGALSFLNRPIRLLPPTIIRPVTLWSGKQVISTLVINLVPDGKPLPSFDIETKINPKMLITGKPSEQQSGAGGTPLREKEMCESQVIFRHGELLCGVMDKVNFGANKNGLIHICYELYGGDTHTKLLTAIARVATNYLQSHHGFTLGIHDILVQAKPNAKRRKMIEKSAKIGAQAVMEAFQVNETPTTTNDSTNQKNFNQTPEEKIRFAHTSGDDFHLKLLDSAYKQYTDKLSNQISSVCLPKGLVKPFPENNLQLMIQTGAKGGSVNAIQISCLLGQIELEGRRIPLMMSGRTLPSFRAYEPNPRAGGFVTGRFLTGIRPQEFFFHCMAGREGLIDTAVKTSRSGYLQRCLIKHLEGLVVNYDLTVRDSEGSIVQWLYGEDGLDITRSQSLKRSFFPTIMQNRSALRPSKDELKRLKKSREEVSLTKKFATVRKSITAAAEHHRRQRATIAMQSQSSVPRDSPFLRFETEYRQLRTAGTATGDDEEEDTKMNNNNISIINISREELTNAWYNLKPTEREVYYHEVPTALDPIISRYRPDLNFGAISETLDSVIQSYIDTDLGGSSSTTTTKVDRKVVKEFKNTLNACYMRALCAPGEAVGLLAAQSIGEPSTQMTLNTFHFAGRGEMNVTLGVPRLRELLMTASPNISTPSMDIPFRTDLPPEVMDTLPIEAEQVRLRLNAVKVKDVLEYVDVYEVIEIGGANTHQRYRNYRVKFQFLPRNSYKTRCYTKPAKVLHYMETVFIKQFIEAMNRRIRALTRSSGLFDKNDTARQRTTTATSAARRRNADVDEEELMMQAGGDDGGGEDAEAEKKRLSMDNVDDDDDDDDAEDLDLDDGEGDTTAMKHKTRLTQDREYEEPDQEEIEEMDDEYDDGLDDGGPTKTADGTSKSKLSSSSAKKGSKNRSKNTNEEEESLFLDDDDDDVTQSISFTTMGGSRNNSKPGSPAADTSAAIDTTMSAQRRNRVIDLGNAITDYQYDVQKERWCEVTFRFELIAAKLDLRSVLMEETEKAFIYRVGRIKRAFLVKDNDAAKRGARFTQRIQTEGVSLAHVVEFERLLDLRRIYTNDMHAIARTYGIEAARAALIREISNVFAVYGISVDGRHLSLIADHMTFTGVIKGMNRGAMDGISPIQAMTFETTTNFLKNSLLLDIKDDLQSPSSRLVIGRPTLVGSGLFETRLDPSCFTGIQPNVTFGTGVIHRTNLAFDSALLSGKKRKTGVMINTSFGGGGSSASVNKKRISWSIGGDDNNVGSTPSRPTPSTSTTTTTNEINESEDKDQLHRTLGLLATPTTTPTPTATTPIPTPAKRVKIEFDI